MRWVCLSLSEALSCRWNRSTRSFELGWYAVVRMCFEPNNRISSFHRHESNRPPLSVKMIEGTPIRAIRLLMKAGVTVSAMISVMWMASSHRLNQSMQVSIYLNPLDGGSAWANDVEVHHIKPCIRSGEGRQGCNRMLMKF